MFNTKQTFKKRNPFAVELWSDKYRPRKEKVRTRCAKPKHRNAYLKELQA